MTRQVFFAALFAVSAVWAEEDAEKPVADAAAVVQPVKEVQKAPFTTLPLCRQVEGEVYVRLIGASDWSSAEEGRFYPLGTSFRTVGNGRLTVAFASDASVSILGDSEFATRAQALGVRSRTIVLVRGTVELKLADNLPEGLFFVSAPGFLVKNPAGESRYVYEDVGDGDKASVFCRTGSLGVEGRHFDIPVMRAANEVVIRTSHDLLSTFLYGTRGDYTVKLDKNLRLKEEIGDDGKMKRTEGRETAEFRLSPETKVIINRSLPALGERMSAFIMAFDASGERLGEGLRVCEGRAEINGGELVSKEKLKGEELAKRAAAATDAAASAEAAETTTEEDSATSSNEKASDDNETEE